MSRLRPLSSFVRLLAQPSRSFSSSSSSAVSTSVRFPVANDPSNPFTLEDYHLHPLRLVGYKGATYQVVNPNATLDPYAPSKLAPNMAIHREKNLNMQESLARVGKDMRTFWDETEVVTYHGSLAVFPNFCVNWKVSQLSEITPESLAIVELIQPTPTLVLFGTGKVTEFIPPAAAAYLHSLGIGFEVYDSSLVLGSFNMLAIDEDRRVCAFILPTNYSSDQNVNAKYIVPPELSKRTERPSTAIRKRIEEEINQKKKQ